MRKPLLAVGAAGLAALFVWGLAGLPRFGSYPGPYGDFLNSYAVGERKATDIVSAVNFDYRAFDTMGEEFILFASVAGAALLLRKIEEEEDESKEESEFIGARLWQMRAGHSTRSTACRESTARPASLRRQ